MKRRIMTAIALVLSLALMQGCGSSGGSSNSADLISDIPIDNSGGGGGGGTGGGGTGAVGDLGPLIDLGDLIYPSGDHWYYTRVRAINNQGKVIGESNNGFPTYGAFIWDPVLQGGQPMIFLGIHNGIYNDYYLQKVTNPITEPEPFVNSEAVDINGSGTVICNSRAETGEKRAFMWDDGFVDLPPLPGILVNGEFTDKSINSYSEVVDINDKGEMVLTLDDNTIAGRHAYYWDGVSTVDVNIPRDDGTFILATIPDYQFIGTIVGGTSEAVALNENGQILMNSEGTALFFDRNHDVLEVFNQLPGGTVTVAIDINDSIYTNNDDIPDGHVIGNSGNDESLKSKVDAFLGKTFLSENKSMTLSSFTSVQGFFWDGGAMYPINSLGGGKSLAADINDQDQVVGGALTEEGATHAILWTLGADKKGIIRDLGTLGGVNSMALAINEAGQVVGWSETGAYYQEQGLVLPIRHGFLWSEGKMYDLGTHDDFYNFPFKPPYPFSVAVDINDSGALTGNSITINDHPRGFYLMP